VFADSIGHLSASIFPEMHTNLGTFSCQLNGIAHDENVICMNKYLHQMKGGPRANPILEERKMKLELMNLVAAATLAVSLATGTAHAADKDIVDTAVAAGDFKTLAAALTAAGLVDTLKGPGPFTVFAPTDAAFDALPAGTVEKLLKPENKDQLTAVLTYHVVSGKVMAADVVKMSEAKTVNGASLKISTTGEKVIINDTATVAKTDIAASNGVIHVIDTVLLPPTK
jgi:uncharacterized surface protein with fasciclin (FAS1) repeats